MMNTCQNNHLYVINMYCMLDSMGQIHLCTYNSVYCILIKSRVVAYNWDQSLFFHFIMYLWIAFCWEVHPLGVSQKFLSVHIQS